MVTSMIKKMHIHKSSGKDRENTSNLVNPNYPVSPNYPVNPNHPVNSSLSRMTACGRQMPPSSIHPSIFFDNLKNLKAFSPKARFVEKLV